MSNEIEMSDVQMEDCSKETNKKEPTLMEKCMAEFVGTMFIILFGVGSVNGAVLTGSLAGLWQVAVVWGLGVSFGILVSADISDAHLNPAVSIALSLLRGFSWYECVCYILAQIAAGIVGGLINYFIFMGAFDHFEELNDVSGDNCVKTAMIFGEYYPNPGMYSDWGDAQNVVTTTGAFFIEAWGTGILMFMIFAITDSKNSFVTKGMIPFAIGFTVSMLISVYAPLTQAGWNPARDFGPRVAGWMVGLGDCAIPGPRGGFWVYIFGPIVGAPLGGLLYDFTIGRSIPEQQKEVIYCRVKDNDTYI